MMRALLATVLLPALLGTVCAQSTTVTIEDILIDSFNKEYPKMAKLDDPESRKAKLELAKKDPLITSQVAYIVSTYGGRTEFTKKEVDKLCPAVKPEIEVPKGLKGFLIRDSYQSLDYSQKALEATKAKPATFSFANSFLDDSVVWTATGSIMRPISFGETWQPKNDHSPYFSGLLLVPSISFNRISGGPPDKQVNSLIFRGGTDFEVSQLSPPHPSDSTMHMPSGSLHFRPDFAYSTDFMFQSTVLAGEADLEYTYGPWGIGAFSPLFYDESPLQYSIRIFAHAEGGTVVSAGNIASLKGQSDIARVGASAELQLQFDQIKYYNSFVKGFLLSGKFEDYESFTDAPTIRLFSGSLSYRFDSLFSMEFVYQDGRLPLTAQRVNLFTIGLGIKL